MKKILFVMPIMAVSLLASCGGGKKTTWAVKMKVTANENEVISFDCGVKDTFTVNWGDGTTNSEKSHTYAAGTYDIQINNQLETFTYTSENRDSILELEINDLLAIGAYSFENCAKLTTIKFTNNTSLQKTVGCCFRECSQLTSVNLEDCTHLQEIGDETFNDCSSLTSIIIPNEVTIIGESAFGSSGLQTVDFMKESKLETIDETAFAQCHNLVSIKIPNSIKRIRERAFYECPMLTYDIKNNIKYLGNDSNPYVVAMEVTDEKQSSSYTLDEGCRIMYSSLFSKCTNLTSITIPRNVITIGINSFEKCTNLETISFESNSILEIIDDYAFENCSALTAITIPNAVTRIGNNAFRNCSSLTDISIPNSISYIGRDAFRNCDLSSSYSLKDKVNYLGNDSNPYLVVMETNDEKQSSNYTLSEDCRIIYTEAFEYCNNLTSLIIPNKVTSIGPLSFAYCSSLNSISMPDSLVSIDLRAFDSCTSLTTINIPSSVTSIGEYAFSYCSSLNSITIDEANAIYEDGDTNAIIKKGSHVLIRGANNTIIPDTVTSIDNQAFSGCSSLSSIKIPNSVTLIGNRAFQQCYNLNSIKIPNSITLIKTHAFSSCSTLETVDLTSFVEEDANKIPNLESSAFPECHEDLVIKVANGKMEEIFKNKKYWNEYADKIHAA